MERLESFNARVRAATGFSLNDLPRRRVVEGDGIGHIFCVRGAVFVCAVGYPTHTDEETGEEVYDTFEVCLLG